MIRLKRTEPADPDLAPLVRHLDAELAVRDGDEYSYHAQFNKLEALRGVVLAYFDGRAAGCGAIKDFSGTEMEIKRMFTEPEFRGKGIASAVLAELEKWAGELGFSACVLETGWRQPEAIALYRRSGYIQIPNYGQYAGIENSVCFRKDLSQPTPQQP